MDQSIEKTYDNKMFILINVVLMIFMDTLDSSIVNVALPKMSQSLSVSTESIAWVVTSYLIVISATILIFGRLGDIKGMTKVFQYGVLLFTIASLMCGISNSLPVLIVARIIQAIGAAATMATNQAIITKAFPNNERGKALGIVGTFVALGTMVGPPLGGFIIGKFTWHYIFFINVPIGIIVFFIGMKILPKSHKALNERIDIKGAILFMLSIVLLFGSLSVGQNMGYTSPAIILCLAATVIFFILFIIVEKKIKQPLLKLDIFKNTLFSLSIFCAFIAFTAISCANIIQPFYLQYVMKLSPFSTGMVMVVFPVIMFFVAPISGYLSDKIGSEFLTFLGLVFITLGLFLMSTLNEHSSLVTLIIFIAIMSVGNGLFQSPNTSLIMSNVSKNKIGVAGSINALVRNIGIVFGISFSISILYGRMSSKIGYHVLNYVSGRDDIFIYGMKGVYVVIAIMCIVGTIVTGIRLYGKRLKALNK